MELKVSKVNYVDVAIEVPASRFEDFAKAGEALLIADFGVFGSVSARFG